MTIVERKGKINIQISIDPFLLFVLTSVFLHGIGLLILVLSNRSLPAARQETESTPIDFVLVPPEESPEEPPLDTERRAVNNSVAKGKVEPELPSATDKIGNEKAIATSEPSQGTKPDIQETPSTSVPPIRPPVEEIKPTPPVVSKPQPIEQSQPPVKTPTPLSKIPKRAIAPSTSLPPIRPPAAEVKPTPPIVSKPQPIEQSQPPVKPPTSLSKVPKLAIAPSTSVPPITPPAAEVKPTPPVVSKPQPIEQSQPPVKPPTSLSKVPKRAIAPSTSVPPITPPAAEVKPTPPIVSKPQPREKLPPLSESGSPSIPRPKPTPRQEATPSREIETATPKPDLPPVATNLPPKAKPIKPSSLPTETPPNSENSSVPETTPTPSSEQKTPVGSGAASLLGGTQSRSLSDDSGSSFFNPKANASQQALNPRGLDARQDLDLGPYFAEIRRRVRRNWKPSVPINNRHTVLAFSIQRNGQITGLRVIQSSGSDKIDRESLEAVQKSGPFSALPANFPDEQLKVQFKFNIYINQGISRPQLDNWQRF